MSTLAVGLASALGFLVGFLNPLLRDSLSLSRAQLGLIVSVYFGSTGVGSVAGGILADLLGARRAIVADLVVVAIAAGVVAAVGTYPALLLASAVAGLGYSLTNAGTNLAVSASVPLGRRAQALTTKTAGVPAGVALGSFGAPWIGQRWGWQAVIGGVAGAAAVAAVVAGRTIPNARRPEPQDSGRRLPPRFFWYPVASFFLIAGSQPLFSWTVPYLVEALGLSLTAAGLVSSFGALLGVAGMIFLARWADRLGPARRRSAVVLLAGVTAGGAALVGLGEALGVVVAAGGFAAAVVAQLASIGIMHAAVVDVAPSAVGRASGVTMTGYYLGALVSPSLFGLLTDWKHSYPFAWSLCVALLAVSVAAFRRCPTAADRAAKPLPPAVASVRR